LFCGGGLFGFDHRNRNGRGIGWRYEAGARLLVAIWVVCTLPRPAPDDLHPCSSGKSVVMDAYRYRRSACSRILLLLHSGHKCSQLGVLLSAGTWCNAGCQWYRDSCPQPHKFAASEFVMLPPPDSPPTPSPTQRHRHKNGHNHKQKHKHDADMQTLDGKGTCFTASQAPHPQTPTHNSRHKHRIYTHQPLCNKTTHSSGDGILHYL
jgi:hypothetical protein